MPRNNYSEVLKGRIQLQNPGTDDTIGLIHATLSANRF
jgi:hypothetical protein